MAVAVAVATGGAPAAPDPYQIFANARAFWMSQRYPDRIDYTIAVAVTEGGHPRIERYRADYDAVNGTISVDPTSDYELAHPVKPSGIDVGILLWRIDKPLPAIDFLGVPRLAPTYSFGMAPFVPAPTPTPFNSAALVQQIREQFHDPDPRATAPPTPDAQEQLKEIATVVAHNRDYVVSLLGTDTIDGHPCYHLGLQPVRDPGRYRIREAWIDERTYAPWQLKDATNFVGGPATRVPWMIHFADLDGAHYISEEDAQAPIAASGEIYTKTAVRFENVVAVERSGLREQIVHNVGNPLEEPPWPGGNQP
jgi:hypothetical protein